MALVNAAKTGDLIVIAAQRQPETERPGLADIHPLAILAKIHRIGRSNDGSARLVVEAQARVHVGELEHSEPFLRVHATTIEETRGDSNEAKILSESLREHIRELAGEAGGNLVEAIAKQLGPAALADAVGAHLPLERHAEVEVLLTTDVVDRLRLVARFVNEAHELHSIRKKIDEEVRSRLGKHQREAILRERMKAI